VKTSPIKPKAPVPIAASIEVPYGHLFELAGFVADAFSCIYFRRGANPPKGTKITGCRACDLLSAVGRFVKEKWLKTGR
jgi:hypothetical protein